MKHQFKFEYLTTIEANNRPDLLKEIKDGGTNGVIIKNFLGKEQLAVVVDAYKKNESEKAALPLNQGVTYPTVFAHVKSQTGDNPEAIANYFNHCRNYMAGFSDDFALNVPELLVEQLKTISGNRPVNVPAGVNNNGLYPFATFRDLNPGTGEMTLHCGLWFYEMFPAFYKHLHTIVGTNNQLSYFILLQKPEKGGELTIYDVTWGECTNKISDVELETKKGERMHLGKNLDSFPLNLEEGDLLIFDGGNIWHRVEMVEGSLHRITLGGFIGFTDDESSIYFWS